MISFSYKRFLIPSFPLCIIKRNKMDISAQRVKYKDRNQAFLEDQIPIKEPYNQFQLWFTEILNDKDVIEPNAMCLTTATKNGIPSSRYVLLKRFGKDLGFQFYTNGNSRKAQEMAENPNVALLFFWPSYHRSVRIEGLVKKLPDSNAVEYFVSRPYGAQIGAMASKQSQPIPSREYLVKKTEVLQKKFPRVEDLVKPPEWSGYFVCPHTVEFWQGQSDRVHDRIRFRKPKDDEVPDGVLLHEGVEGWVYERLSP